MQMREHGVRGGGTIHTLKCRRSVFALVPCAVIAALLTMSPAKADFVCNANSGPDADTLALKLLQGAAPELDPHILACTSRLDSDAKDIDALIARGDVYQRYAEAYMRYSTSKPYPELASAAQAKAIADWKEAAAIEAKTRGINPITGQVISDPLPSKLGNRLEPSGASAGKAK